MRGAFTLLEMLVVIGVIAFLTSTIVPAVVSLQRSNNITFAGQAIADQISVSRQFAASRNETVEVRFITPTSWTGTPAIYTGYHAVQLWAPTESGTSVALDRAFNLPVGIEISNGTTLSPMLSQYSKASSITTGPNAGTYVSFFVRPNGNVVLTGSTSPPVNTSQSPIQSYFFTVVPMQNDTTNTLAGLTNYFAIQVNPDTGRTQFYRP